MPAKILAALALAIGVALMPVGATAHSKGLTAYGDTQAAWDSAHNLALESLRAGTSVRGPHGAPSATTGPFLGRARQAERFTLWSRSSTTATLSGSSRVQRSF